MHIGSRESDQPVVMITKRMGKCCEMDTLLQQGAAEDRSYNKKFESGDPNNF